MPDRGKWDRVSIDSSEWDHVQRTQDPFLSVVQKGFNTLEKWERSMSLSNYPPGAEFDPRAPYNQKDDPEVCPVCSRDDCDTEGNGIEMRFHESAFIQLHKKHEELQMKLQKTILSVGARAKTVGEGFEFVIRLTDSELSVIQDALETAIESLYRDEEDGVVPKEDRTFDPPSLVTKLDQLWQQKQGAGHEFPGGVRNQQVQA